jgi:4'-phosphopantetheinyl transferase
VAISHDGELSLAAFRLDSGPVGIDVMQVTDVPDWEAVARDYLGPDCAAALGHVPAAARADAFARAWSEREARLKCMGMPLAEWDAAETSRLAACTCRTIALPAGYVGTVATATPTGSVAG